MGTKSEDFVDPNESFAMETYFLNDDDRKATGNSNNLWWTCTGYSNSKGYTWGVTSSGIVGYLDVQGWSIGASARPCFVLDLNASSSAHVSS